MASIDDLSKKWLRKTEGKGERWEKNFASADAATNYVEKLASKTGESESTINAGRMAKEFKKSQGDVTAKDFDEQINEKAAKRWARNFKRALTQP